MLADEQVLHHAQVVEEPDVLEGPAHPPGHDLVRRPPADLVTLESDAPRIRRDEPGDQVEQRGLARAVRPDHADQLARPDGQRDVVGGRQSAEALAQPLDLQQGAAGPARGFRARPRQIQDGAARGRGGLLLARERGDLPHRRPQPLAPEDHHQDEDEAEDQLERGDQLDPLEEVAPHQAAEGVDVLGQVLEDHRLEKGHQQVVSLATWKVPARPPTAAPIAKASSL